MKLNPVYIQPKYRINGETKVHPIERLEFERVPENSLEKLGMRVAKSGQNLGESLAHILKSRRGNFEKIEEAFKRA
ncbi:hypothetical protein [Mammaliicoccus sp. JADD-157]|uniref:hypothetical protein n=1 Tax=Mammaliicoccus sp. JADD-157 TaxID=3404818 RepID=UPI003BB7CEA0